MKIHMVAIDLDGTLLNSAKEITDVTAAILRTACKEVGLHVVLASARPPRTVLPSYTLLDLDTPMINYNGALVYEPPSRRVLLHRPLSAKIARGIVTIARRTYPDVIVSGERLDERYTDRLNEAYLSETATLCRPELVAALDEWLDRDLTKLLLLGPPAELNRIVSAVHKAYRHQVQIQQTERDMLQIMHATVSKAQALRVVAGELAIQPDQVMAIGDNANDVGMLRWAGIGVAMANASPEALAAADFITDHHDADGAAKAIHEIIIKGRVPGSKPPRR